LTIYLLILTLIFFAIRIVPRLVFTSQDRAYMSSDKWVHLYYAELFRGNRRRWISAWPRTDVAGPLRLYPPLFHLLLSFMPKGLLLRYEQYITSLIQFMTFAVVIACSFGLAMASGLAQPDLISLIAGATYCFLPVLFGPNSGMVFCTARPFGALLSNIYLISLFIFSVSYSKIAALVCIATFFLCAISSRFAVQTTVFVALIYCILLRDLQTAAVLALSISLTLSLGYRTYRPILKYHYRHLKIYKTVFMQGTSDMLEKHAALLSILKKTCQSLNRK